MVFKGLHHIVFEVDDLPEAEEFYRELFGMEVLFREGYLGDDFGKVPEELDWEEAVERGVEPGISFLHRDDFALAVAEHDVEEGGHLDHVALAVDDEDVEEIEERAERLGCEYERRSHSLFVYDPYGIEWEINPTSPPPETPFEPLDV